MTQNIDLDRYKEFVACVTSKPSNDLSIFKQRMDDLERQSALDGIQLNMPLLLTAGIGLAAEAGEVAEIVKKIAFQGKPYNEDNRHHMMLELGDCMWYIANACRALGYTMNEVLAANVKKLEARYPGGHFDVYMSENRRVGDL